MLDFEYKLNEIQSLLSNLIRVGTVTSLIEGDARARVVFEDRDNTESYDLLALVKNTKDNQDYWMPDVDEQVLCLFLPIGIEQGFILGSYYTKLNPRPASSGNVRKVKFKDGTVIEYDRESHTLTVDVPENGGNVIVNAHTKVTVNSPLIDLGEDADLEPSVLGDKLAQWIMQELKPWLDSHQHIGNLGKPTSPASMGPFGPFEAGNGDKGGNVYSQKNRNQ